MVFNSVGVVAAFYCVGGSNNQRNSPPGPPIGLPGRRQGLAAPIPFCGTKDCSSYATWGGMVLIWVAAILTAITGFDYFRKSLPYLKDDKRE